MSLAIAVTYDDPTATGFYVPGFQVIVSGLSSVTDAATVLVQRVEGGSGAAEDIRGLSHIEVIADSAVATDFEYRYYNDTAGWTYVCTVYDDDDALLATVTSSTFYGTVSVNDMLETYPYTTANFASITQPAVSQPIVINDFPGWNIPPNVLSTLKPLGRKNSVVLTDVFGGKTGSFVILSDPALSNISDDTLVDLLTYNDTFLFQPYWVSGNIGNMYFKVTGLNAARETYAEARPSGERVQTTVMLYTVDFIEVDRPIAGSAPTTLISWQDVFDNNSSWTDVKNGHADWLDVLNNPTG